MNRVAITSRTCRTLLIVSAFCVVLTLGQGGPPYDGYSGSYNENFYIYIWLFAFGFGIPVFLGMSYFRKVNPFVQKLEEMYETESYVVKASVDRHFMTNETGYQGSTRIQTNLVVGYEAHGNDQDDDDDGLSVATSAFILVEKEIVVPSYDGSNTIEMTVLEGFPLTGRILNKKRRINQNREGGCLRKSCASLYLFILCGLPTWLPLAGALANSPFDSSPLPYLLLVGYMIILPSCCYLAVFLCTRELTIEKYRKKHFEKNATVRVAEKP